MQGQTCVRLYECFCRRQPPLIKLKTLRVQIDYNEVTCMQLKKIMNQRGRGGVLQLSSSSSARITALIQLIFHTYAQ